MLSGARHRFVAVILGGEPAVWVVSARLRSHANAKLLESMQGWRDHGVGRASFLVTLRIRHGTLANTSSSRSSERLSCRFRHDLRFMCSARSPWACRLGGCAFGTGGSRPRIGSCRLRSSRGRHRPARGCRGRRRLRRKGDGVVKHRLPRTLAHPSRRTGLGAGYSDVEVRNASRLSASTRP